MYFERNNKYERLINGIAIYFKHFLKKLNGSSA